MKPYVLLSILAMSLLAISCESNDEMLTVINPDGSCYREFTRNADSAFMVGDTSRSNPFPVDLDSGWKITWKYNTPEVHTNWPLQNWKWTKPDTSHRLVVTARREFNDVNEMNTGFRLKKKHEWYDITVKYSLVKKFRWFYTYYTFSEVYSKIKTFDDVPFEKYMTKDEARYWFSGTPDLLKGMNGVEAREYLGDLENRYNNWFTNNYFNAEYGVLLENYEILGIKAVSKERLIQARDSVFSQNVNKDPDSDLEMEKCLNAYFKTDAFTAIKKLENNPLTKFENNLDSLGFIGYFTKSFDYKLLMPGKITQADNAIKHGDTLSWKLSAYRMVYGDYEISAQSRKANSWAFIVSGLIVVLAFGSYFYKSRK